MCFSTKLQSWNFNTKNQTHWWANCQNFSLLARSKIVVMALKIRGVSSNPPKSWKSRKTAKTGYKSKPTKLSLHRATALKFWQLFHHYVLFLVLKFQVCSSVKKQFPPKSAKSNLKKRPPWRQNSGLRGTLKGAPQKVIRALLQMGAPL